MIVRWISDVPARRSPSASRRARSARPGSRACSRSRRRPAPPARPARVAISLEKSFAADASARAARRLRDAQRGRLVDEQARGLDVDVHVGDQLLHHLELGDRPAELLALARPADRVVERRLPRGRPRSRRGCARSTSSPRIIMATPRFSSPIRSAARAASPSKRSSAVGLPRMPILSSLRLQLKPGVFPSTRNTEILCGPRDGSVRA